MQGLVKFVKAYGIPFGLFAVKLLIVARTGLDTYNVSRDILDVLVIDGVYLAMWAVAAYGGKSQSAMALRPFAAAGAWLLYVAMFYIAWQAGDLRGAGRDIAVSLIARLAGFVLLTYDTFDYIHAVLQQRKRDSNASWKDSLRSTVDAVTYIVGAVIAIPVMVIVNVYKAGIDYASDVKPVKVESPRVVVGKATPVMLTRPESDDIDNIILETYAVNSSLTLREAAVKVGISHTAVGNRLVKLEMLGKIRRDSDGIHVIGQNGHN